jgi:hypothetical protein
METNQRLNEFNELNIEIPELVFTHSIEIQREIYEYLKNMNEIQLKAYLIAKKNLGSSFNIYKSNGFKEWKRMATIQ